MTNQLSATSRHLSVFNVVNGLMCKFTTRNINFLTTFHQYQSRQLSDVDRALKKEYCKIQRKFQYFHKNGAWDLG
ncbi:MAG: hypothetical protein HYX61_03130 [Gammaproteobacteria bacterium]|jgi:hypothetical protein|nr:hypothetical protein [Gammaproteobacteria bacterium]